MDARDGNARQRAEPGGARLPHPPQRAAHGRGAGPGLHRAGARRRRRARRLLFPRAATTGRRTRTAEGRDRFLLSIGHYAIALYAALIEAEIMPEAELETYGSDDSRLPMSGMASLHARHGDQRRLARDRARHRGRHVPGAEAQGLRPLRLQPDVGRRAERGPDLGGRDVGRPLEARQPDLPRRREPHAGRRRLDQRSQFRAARETSGEAFGWHVQRVDGNDISALVHAFDAARALAEPKPRVIICDTKMAKGVPFLEAREKSHFMRVEQHEWAEAIKLLEAGRVS